MMNITEQQIIKELQNIEQFIRNNVTPKAIALIGSEKSGKTCLLQFFNGSLFAREDNEDGFPILVQISKPQTQIINYKADKLYFQINIIHKSDPKDETTQISIIQFPSFPIPASPASKVNIFSTMATIHCWQAILLRVQSIHVCIIVPFDFVTNNHNLVQFFLFWERIAAGVESIAQRLKKCISIFFTKAEYEDDKQSLSTSLQHLSKMEGFQQGSQDEIKLEQQNNLFQPSISNDLMEESYIGGPGSRSNLSTQDCSYSLALQNRIYCFLAQETEEGQAYELFQNFYDEAQFFQSSASVGNQSPISVSAIFKDNWTDSVLNLIINKLGEDQIQNFVESIVKLGKYMCNNQQYFKQLLDKNLKVLGQVLLLRFLTILPKQCAQLHKKQPQLQNQIQKLEQKSMFKRSFIPTCQNKRAEQQNMPKRCLQILNQFYNNLLAQQKNQSTLKQIWKILVPSLMQFCKAISQQFSIQQIRVLRSYLKYSLNGAYMIDTVVFLCKKHSQIKYLKDKRYEMLHQHAHELEDMSHQLAKKYILNLKNKLTNGIKSQQIFSKISSVKSLSDSQELKTLLPFFGDNQQQQFEEGEEDVVISDPRIKRYYYKAEPNMDLFADIKQRAKKVQVKTPIKQQQINQRQYIKNLFNQLQHEPQNRTHNLLLLHKKLIQYKLYNEALQVSIQLGKAKQLYQFLTTYYLPELDQVLTLPNSVKSSIFFSSKLIMFLQQKCHLYTQSTVDEAKKFMECLHLCYDFIMANYTQSKKQFEQLLEISNQIPIPDASLRAGLEEDDLGNIDKNDEAAIGAREQDKRDFKYITFSKAQIIQKIHKRDQNKKKNMASLAQIQRYKQATKPQTKGK